MKGKNEKKALIFQNGIILYDGRQKVINAFEIGIFPKRKQTQGKWRQTILVCIAKVSDSKQLKILTPKQMLQRLPIAFAQAKTGNTPEGLLNDIYQIIHSLYWAKEKEITKKGV